MKTTKVTPLTAIFLASMLFATGCSVSPTPPEDKKDQETLSDVITKGPLPALATNLPLNLKTESLESEVNAPNVALKRKTHQPQPMRLLSTASSVQMGFVAKEDGILRVHPIPTDQESYNFNRENSFISVNNDPLSTFSIDVDTASYSNIRRFIQNGQLPPVGAVRIEEMLNYFSYDYLKPQSGPFALSTELGPCPWNNDNRLVRIGIQAKNMEQASLPPSNLVFLIDVSGSMHQENKLPLLKKSMLMLLKNLTAKDRVAIVVYAGSDRVVLPPTSGDKKELIKKAIDTLTSGGSTHASKGIETAYKLAEQGFMPSGNNRIILASDGDFNVGITSRGELERLISAKKESGVYLTVLGFGMGNYHDDSMEILADKGNGNYAYIDSLLEAKKVLVKERTSTLFILASDVKLQIEFNPAKVGAYRLLGYENRALADEDFNDDKKDAGEIGIGHRVTALYEIIPAGSANSPKVDQLKYQLTLPNIKSNENSNEILTVKLRYKPIKTTRSVLLTHSLADNENSLVQTSNDFRFASAVAGYGLLLNHSEHGGTVSYSHIIEIAKNSRGNDPEGYRAEFIRLLEMSEMLTL